MLMDLVNAANRPKKWRSPGYIQLMYLQCGENRSKGVPIKNLLVIRYGLSMQITLEVGIGQVY